LILSAGPEQAGWQAWFGGVKAQQAAEYYSSWRGGLMAMWELLSPEGSVQFFHVSCVRTGRVCLVSDETEMPATVKLTI
jgi:hypothetical protein